MAELLGDSADRSKTDISIGGGYSIIIEVENIVRIVGVFFLFMALWGVVTGEITSRRLVILRSSQPVLFFVYLIVLVSAGIYLILNPTFERGFSHEYLSNEQKKDLYAGAVLLLTGFATWAVGISNAIRKRYLVTRRSLWLAEPSTIEVSADSEPFRFWSTVCFQIGFGILAIVGGAYFLLKVYPHALPLLNLQS